MAAQPKYIEITAEQKHTGWFEKIGEFIYRREYSVVSIEGKRITAIDPASEPHRACWCERCCTESVKGLR